MRISLIISIIIVVAGILSDILIYKRLNRIKKFSWLKYLHLAVAILVYAALASVPIKVGSGSINTVMWGLLISISFIFSKLLYALLFLVSCIPSLCKKSKRWNAIEVLGIVLGCVSLCTFWWGALITINRLEINEVTIRSNKIPTGFKGYRIVQFSDLHSGTYGKNQYVVKKLVAKINSLNPDLIVFTGDIVTQQTTEILPFIAELKKLKAKDGVISILGNHDYGDYMKWDSDADKKKNLDWLISIQRDSLGWNLLNNDHTYLHCGNDSLLIIGVENWGEPPFTTYGDLAKATPSDSYQGFKLLLSHNPKHWEHEVVGKTDIDLTLSGHTHAMQTMLTIGDKKYSPASLRYNHWGGLSTENGQSIYVNIGIGEVGVPMRIGATPEITVFTLTH